MAKICEIKPYIKVLNLSSEKESEINNKHNAIFEQIKASDKFDLDNGKLYSKKYGFAEAENFLNKLNKDNGGKQIAKLNKVGDKKHLTFINVLPLFPEEVFKASYSLFDSLTADDIYIQDGEVSTQGVVFSTYEDAKNYKEKDLNSNQTINDLEKTIKNTKIQDELFIFGEKISEKISKIQSFDTSHIKGYDSFELDNVISVEKETNKINWKNSGEREIGSNFSDSDKLEFLDKNYFQISNKQERTKRNFILASFYHLSEVSSDPNKVFKRIENNIKKSRQDGAFEFNGLFFKLFGEKNIGIYNDNKITINIEKLVNVHKNLPMNEHYDRSERILLEEYIHLISSNLITQQEEDIIFKEMSSKEKSRVVKIYGEPLNDRQIVHEYLRMIVQKKEFGEITELGKNTIYAIFKRALSYLIKSFDNKPLDSITVRTVNDILQFFKKENENKIDSNNLYNIQQFFSKPIDIQDIQEELQSKSSYFIIEDNLKDLLTIPKFVKTLKNAPADFPFNNYFDKLANNLIKLKGIKPHTEEFRNQLTYFYPHVERKQYQKLTSSEIQYQKIPNPELLLEYNNNEAIWSISNNFEQYEEFKKTYKGDDFINDYTKFVQLSNINDRDKTNFKC